MPTTAPVTEAIMLRVPVDLKEWIQEIADQEERSLNMVIRRILQAERARQWALQEMRAHGQDN